MPKSRVPSLLDELMDCYSRHLAEMSVEFQSATITSNRFTFTLRQLNLTSSLITPFTSHLL
jgi:hypothetical protein